MEELINNPEIMLRVDLEKEVYSKYYHDLVDFCKNKYPGRDKSIYTDYLEEHHILPRCMGGKDEDSNLVLMNYRCHVLAHCLLFLMDQDNVSLAWAARCMLQIQTRGSINYATSIEDIISCSEKLKELANSSAKKPIVCLDVNLNIIRVYEGTLDINKDGFKAKTVSYSIREGRLHFGYFWKTLEEVEKEFPKELETYYKLSESGKLPKLHNDDPEWVKEQFKYYRDNIDTDAGKWVIGYDDTTYCIFCKISRAVNLGFTASSISMSLSNPAKTNFGYHWVLCSDKSVDEIKSTRTKVDVIYPKPIRDIICYDKEKDIIIRIYKTQRETAKDGFDYTRICEVLKKDVPKYLGYYWYYRTEWKRQDLIEKYEDSETLPDLNPINLYQPKKIIQLNKEGDVVGIFNNLHSVPNFDYRALSRTINRKNRLYKGYFWYTYQEILKTHPDKLKKYEERY